MTIVKTEVEVIIVMILTTTIIIMGVIMANVMIIISCLDL